MQGGSVVRALLKDKEWKIRGITRDTSKDAAKDLEKQGVEVVSANIDDEESLLRAFEVRISMFLLLLFPKTCYSILYGHMNIRPCLYERSFSNNSSENINRASRQSSQSRTSGSTCSQARPLRRHATKKSNKVFPNPRNSIPKSK